MAPDKKKKPSQEDRQPQRGVTPPRETISNPSSHRESALPLVDVGSRQFEELCREIVEVEFPSVNRKSLKRTSGVEQFGVDVEGFVPSGCPEIVISAKCYKEVDAWEFRPWIEDFSKHIDDHWKDKGVKHFVLAITVEANNDDMNQAAKNLIGELGKAGIQFHLWDKIKITDLLLQRPHLIDRYFNRYWRDALSADIASNLPSIGAPTNRGLAGMGPGLQLIADQLQGLFLGPLEDAYRKELESATKELRQGVREPIRQWLVDKRSNPDIWNALSPETKSKGLRAAAMVALGDRDTNTCRVMLDEADAFHDPPDRTFRVFLTSAVSGTTAALGELQSPVGTRERELYAGLLLTDGKPAEALAALEPLLGADVSSEVLRLRAIAQFRLGDTQAALYLAKSAVDKSPTFAMPRFALGVLRIGAALAGGVTLSFVGSPNPISRSLVRFGEEAPRMLAEAIKDFDRLIERVDGDLKAEAEVWKLAALLLNPQTRSRGRDFARSLMARQNPDPVVVAWCLHYGLPIKRGKVKKLFGDKLRGGEGDESHVTILALLSGDEPKKSLAVLERFAPLFPDASTYFNHWREQFGEVERGSNPSYPAAITVAIKKGDFTPLRMFMLSNLATPETLMAGAEFLASRSAFEEINAVRPKLLDIDTARAIEISAVSALNTNDPESCLDILQMAAERGLEISGILVEMRLRARRVLGHHHDLIEDLETLLLENDDWKIREQLIDAHVRIGSLERVKEEAEKALESGDLGDRNAVQLAYALRNVAPDVARKMLEKADWTQLPDEMSGALLSLSTVLGLADIRDGLLSKIIANPETNSVVRTFHNLEEVLEEVKKISDTYKSQLDAWAHGRIPAALAFSGHPKDFVKLFLADPRYRKNGLGDKIPMFLAGAGVEVSLPKPDDTGRQDLRVDLGALMLGERLGLLDLLEEDFIVWTPESLPEALDELNGQFGEVNETIAETVLAIDKSESAVRIVDVLPDRSMEIHAFNDPENLETQVAMAEILRRAYQAGHLTTEQLNYATAKLEIEKPALPQPFSATSIVVSGGALAELARLEVIEQVARGFPIYILRTNLTHLRAQIDVARDEERMGRQLGELRRKVSAKLKTGRWRTIVRQIGSETHTDKPVHLRCLLEVFPREQPVLLWLEDRMLSRATAAQIFTVIPLVSELVRKGRLTSKREKEIRAELRAWGYTFAPIDPAEIAAILERTPVIGGLLVENDDVDKLRTWFARDVQMLRYTDQTMVLNEQGRAIGETRRFHDLLGLKDHLLEIIWKHPTASAEERRARSRWVWSNLRLQYLPDPPGASTAAARRLLTTMNAAQAMAVPLHALLHQVPISGEVFQQYFEWLTSEVLEQLGESDPESSEEVTQHIASMLARMLESDTDTDPKVLAHLQRHMSRLVRNYLSLIPSNWVDQIVAKDGLAEKLPRGTVLSLTVDDKLSVPVKGLQDGFAKALSDQTAKIKVPGRIGDDETKIELVATASDKEIKLELKFKKKTIAVDQTSVALIHPDEAVRRRLLLALPHRDALGDPFAPTFLDTVAKEPDVEARVQNYLAELDRDFGRNLHRLGELIASRTEVNISDFDLPDPAVLLRFLGLPYNFVGSGPELAAESSFALIDKMGIQNAMVRLSSLPVELGEEILVQFAAHAPAIGNGPPEPPAMAFARVLGSAHTGAPVDDLIAQHDWSVLVEQLRVFNRLLRRSIWQALKLPAWQDVPEEMMFCLVWLHADQLSRLITRAGREPKSLEQWFVHHTTTKLADFPRFRRLEGWIQNVVLKSTAARLLASFTAKLLTVGVAIPDRLKNSVGKTEKTEFTPLPDVAAARVLPPEGYWIIADAIPAFVGAGWISKDSVFADRDPTGMLRTILGDDFGTNSPVYAQLVSVLVPLEAVEDHDLLERLSKLLSATIENSMKSESDPAFALLLDVASEVHAQTGDVHSFEKVVVNVAASHHAQWPHDRVRLDESEAGRAAINLLNAVYTFGSMGHGGTLVDRMKEVTEIMSAISDAWPGVRLAILSVLDDLADQVDADTACQTIWPTALELRSR